MHHPIDRIAHTTAFVTPVVEHWLEREIAQWVHPMKDRSDDPSHHERTLLPRRSLAVQRDQVSVICRVPATFPIKLFVVVCIYFRAYIHLRFKHAVVCTRLNCLSVWESELVRFVSLLVVNKRDEFVRALHLQIWVGVSTGMRAQYLPAHWLVT